LQGKYNKVCKAGIAILTKIRLQGIELKCNLAAMPVRAFILFFLLIACSPAIAQTIRGEVLDMETGSPVTGVNIENIHTSLDISTDDKGAFLIAAAGGQLLEFKKNGYKTERVRVPQGFIPPYFRIIMKQGIPELKDKYANNRYDYKFDSIKMHELYAHELDFPKMSAIDMISHPFSAMSGKNREMWRFQDEYDDFEKEKYVDMTFNPEIISKITGLKGDSVRNYIRRYRPSYQQLRGMTDYALFSYIRSTVHSFRSPNIPRGAQ
jgi:hypothetical protein